jgi:hypothetical protein
MMEKAGVDDAVFDHLQSEWRAQVMCQIDSATSKNDRDVWLSAFLSSADNAGLINMQRLPTHLNGETPLINSKGKCNFWWVRVKG